MIAAITGLHHRLTVTTVEGAALLGHENAVDFLLEYITDHLFPPYILVIVTKSPSSAFYKNSMFIYLLQGKGKFFPGVLKAPGK